MDEGNLQNPWKLTPKFYHFYSIFDEITFSLLVNCLAGNNQEMKKPEFLKEIEDQEVKEGQHVKFRAKVKGYPLPRVVWYKDGHLLKNGTNYKIGKNHIIFNSSYDHMTFDLSLKIINFSWEIWIFDRFSLVLFFTEKFGNRDYLLNVEYATPEDDAEYWVVAKNVAGEAKSTAQLIVQSKELGTCQGN